MKRRVFLAGAAGAAVTTTLGVPPKVVAREAPQKEPENPEGLAVIKFSKDGKKVINLKEIIEHGGTRDNFFMSRDDKIAGPNGIFLECAVWLRKKDAMADCCRPYNTPGLYWGKVKMHYAIADDYDVSFYLQTTEESHAIDLPNFDTDFEVDEVR